MNQVRLQGKTNQANPIHTWIFIDVFSQRLIRHPLQNNLQRICCDADERDDIWVLLRFQRLYFLFHS